MQAGVSCSEAGVELPGQPVDSFEGPDCPQEAHNLPRRDTGF